MADIRCTATNKVFYRIDDSVAAMLLEALPSVFERASEGKTTPVARQVIPSLAPTPPRWNVGQLPQSGDYFIRLSTGRSEIFYTGAPENAAEHFRRGGQAVPEEIVAQYAAIKSNQPNPEWPAEKELQARNDLEAKQKR